MLPLHRGKTMHDSKDYDQDDDFVSKSQLKREAEAQQELGRQLVDLSAGKLDKMPLDAELLDAIQLAQRIRNKREGFRRQLQHIGKMMRHRDTAPIEQALDELEHAHHEQNALFHQLEKYRDEILADGDSAIQEFLTDYPLADRQKLRQLYRQAQKQQQQGKPPAAARELFKYLREVATA
ncbi:ribosome-associated protein [Pseudidiomarina sp. 1APP75-32.1]|uniref:Dual-action ribosomal maturation protein DarP n=2 Tax=Pseudidiomarina terrestris TaxID=2820060 RepID=A0AAW7QWM5_9GAMM|nr:ribosome-associated protein [Pseudidiomarina sp. 1APP75-32.1]MDN7126289.1 ribosome-associated protein [Pseudidiomarina sp. 1APR75-33.1]MDN7129421.1 ribosome-associated protein [Pseudidiomarina sp. 1APR75-15]MDN7134314.1 ribosome-associated protein [Pseudidiomarina sp. 1ASP75-5]MDN7136998.1 ribosome-associated protein [Pseudidiomarina sp. 1ASP75-14]MEA3587892.1 ribosome-associated protein [Pseudidiomarina sp. 1APP75-27a]